MATKAELEAKIAKAKANKMLPENLKKKIIEKAQNELIELHQKELKGKRVDPKKATKEEMEHAFGKEFMESDDKGAKKTYAEEKKEVPAKQPKKQKAKKELIPYSKYADLVAQSLAKIEDMSEKDATGIIEANEIAVKNLHQKISRHMQRHWSCQRKRKKHLKAVARNQQKKQITIAMN